jgi:hypothetical protein
MPHPAFAGILTVRELDFAGVKNTKMTLITAKQGVSQILQIFI